jgi:hypothetical protein
MKLFCILIFACLLSTACTSNPTPPMTPDNKATIEAGVMQALTAQANQAAITQTLSAMPISTYSQSTQPSASNTPTATQISENTPMLESTSTSSNPTPNAPQIKITVVPPLGSSDDLQGTVEGVNPDMYVVAVYIRVSGGWWTKPTFANPTTPIAGDGSWDCQCWTGGDDTSATAIRAYLIPIGYNPPTMAGGPSLPSALTKHAVAMYEANR